MSEYQRIALAIDFLVQHRLQQPSLAEAARYVELSPGHFQRQFRRWVGVSPKRYLQALIVDEAKSLLAEATPTLAIADQLGLSSGSRLYDHFVHLEAMSPGEYQRGGEGLHIRYSRQHTPFGAAMVASTPRGICHFSFIDTPATAGLPQLQRQWPNALFSNDDAGHRALIDQLFSHADTAEAPISLHVKGTNFQIQVWRALLNIAPGTLSTYRRVAHDIDRPSAARAVGQAVGANPVALLIPCHRVIRESGGLGGYRWGLPRKRAVLGLERARYWQS